jgi:hypothetical protein
VFDLAGGTFDVSILDVAGSGDADGEAKVFEVILAAVRAVVSRTVPDAGLTCSRVTDRRGLSYRDNGWY